MLDGMNIARWGAVIVCAGAGLRIVVGCGSDESAAPRDGGLSADGAPLPGTTSGTAAPIPRDQLLPALLDAFCTPLPDCCKAAGIEYIAGACSALTKSADGADAGPYSFIPPTDNGTTYDPQAGGDCVAYYKGVLGAYNELCKQDPVPTMKPGQTDIDFIIEQTQAAATNPSSPLIQQQSQGCYRMFTGTKEPGAACDGQWQCAVPKTSIPYGAAAFCDPTKDADAGVCQTVSLVAEGDACDVANGTRNLRLCIDKVPDSADPKTLIEASMALYCDDQSHTCKRRAAVADGQTCDREKSRCADHSYCRSSDKTCQSLLAAGSECTGDDNCTAGQCDDTGHCAYRKAPGSACTDEDECTTTRCGKVVQTCQSYASIFASTITCTGKP